jgi:ACS family D-galactonate transporter-like MFS transporter
MSIAQPKLSGRLLLVLVLLAFSVFINYVDRGNLSIAAPMLKDELKLSSTQLGILFSSFFWTYAAFQIVSGWLVDRFEVNWAIAIGFFVWSMATTVTGMVHTFLGLLLARLILGMGESVAYPAYSKILVRDFPQENRGLANSAISAGNACGPALGAFLGGMLMARFGWRSFFVSLGLVSLVWLVPWFRWMPRTQTGVVAETRNGPGFKEILRQRSAWGTCLGLFCLNYLLYFLITWLPFYLVRERGFSLTSMAKIVAAAYLLTAISALCCGWLSDRWIAAGSTATRVRKAFMVAGAGGGGILLGACVVAGPTLAVVLLMMAGVAFGLGTSNLWAITQTLAGPRAVGRWTGVQNVFGSLAGVLAPAITGFVVDRTGEFFWAFAILAGVALVGALSWIFIVGPVEPVGWVPREAPLAAEG